MIGGRGTLLDLIQGYNADEDDDDTADDNVSDNGDGTTGNDLNDDGDGTTGDDLNNDGDGMTGDDVDHDGDGGRQSRRRWRRRETVVAIYVQGSSPSS